MPLFYVEQILNTFDAGSHRTIAAFTSIFQWIECDLSSRVNPYGFDGL